MQERQQTVESKLPLKKIETTRKTTKLGRIPLKTREILIPIEAEKKRQKYVVIFTQIPISQLSFAKPLSKNVYLKKLQKKIN